MKSLVTALLCFQLTVPALGAPQKSLIRSDPATDIELEQFTEVNPEFIPFSRFLLQKKIHDPARVSLIRDFENAQGDFLDSSFAKARISFSKVAGRAHEFSWPEADRKLIHTSLLRLAQLDSKIGDEWIEKAALFAPDLPVDRSLFPPPLVSKYLSAKRSAVTDMKMWRPGFLDRVRIILIDGRVFKVRPGTAVPVTKGPHRIEVLSNSDSADEKILSREEILAYEFPKRPIAGGSCENPKFYVAPPEASIFFGLTCIAAPGDGRWVNLLVNDSPAGSEGVSLALPPTPDIEREKSSPWVWWTLAGLVAGYLVYNESRQRGGESAIQPTHQTGTKK